MTAAAVTWPSIGGTFLVFCAGASIAFATVALIEWWERRKP